MPLVISRVSRVSCQEIDGRTRTACAVMIKITPAASAARTASRNARPLRLRLSSLVGARRSHCRCACLAARTLSPSSLAV